MYATVHDVEVGYRSLTDDERRICEKLLEEAAIIIDSMAENAKPEVKNLVSCRMVRRALVDVGQVPMGATQGSISALGYSQSVTYGSNGSSGELYISKMEKQLLHKGNRIGFANALGGGLDD